MDCPACQEQFTAMLEQDAAQLTLQAREHLSGCPACQQEFAGFQRTVGMVRALPVVTPPAAVLPTIYAALDEVSARRQPLHAYWQPLTAGLACAACLALVVWSVVLSPPPGFEPMTSLRPTPQRALSVPGQPLWAPPQAMRAGGSQPRVARPAQSVPGGPRAGVVRRGSVPMAARGSEALAAPEFGGWAVRPTSAASVAAETTPPAAPEVASAVTGSKPAGTFAAGDAPVTPAVAPLRRQPGPLQLSFVPPAERSVGVSVVGELTIDSLAECEATVRVEARRGLRVANARDGLLYHGPIRRGEKLKLPVKLVAIQSGTQRLRIRLVPDVPLGEVDLDVLVEGFTGQITKVGETLVTLRFDKTPADQAIRRMAQVAGARVVIHEDLAGERITQDYSAGVPFAAALRILCETAGCQVDERGEVYHIVK